MAGDTYWPPHPPALDEDAARQSLCKLDLLTSHRWRIEFDS
jgi:hypothetical protein